MAKTIVKSQDKIDNRKNLMALIGAKVVDKKIVYEDPEEPIIVVDVESTGLDTKKDRIIQISAIKYKAQNGTLVEIERFDEYLKQSNYNANAIIAGKNGCRDKTFQELTGISQETIDNAEPEEDVMKRFAAFMGENPSFVAYNTPFDFSMIVATCIRLGIMFNVKPEKKLDALVMARDLVPLDEAPLLLDDDGNEILDSKGKPKHCHKLGPIANLYGVDKAEGDLSKTIAFHSSINDVVVTGRLLNVFIKEYVEQIEAELTEPEIEKTRARVESLSYWQGYRGVARVYVNATLNGEFVSYFYDVRKKVWGEKQEGILEQTLVDELKADVLELAECKVETELSKVKSKITASPAFLARYDSI